LFCSTNWHDYGSRASFLVLPATVAGLLCQHHSLLSVTTVTSNDATKVTIYNCRISLRVRVPRDLAVLFLQDAARAGISQSDQMAEILSAYYADSCRD
jgi:hypothetical protein